jgi:hypothetical protein
MGLDDQKYRKVHSSKEKRKKEEALDVNNGSEDNSSFSFLPWVLALIVLLLLFKILSRHSSNVSQSSENKNLVSSTFDDATSAIENGHYKKALSLFEQSCNENNGKGCYIAGSIYAHADDNMEQLKVPLNPTWTLDSKIKLDIVQANTFFQKSCALNYAYACYDLGDNYHYGTNFRQDDTIANTFYLKAKPLLMQLCNNSKEADACNKVAYMFKNRIGGVPQDLPAAKEFYGKACDLHDQNGCNQYASLNRQ